MMEKALADLARAEKVRVLFTILLETLELTHDSQPREIFTAMSELAKLEDEAAFLLQNATRIQKEAMDKQVPENQDQEEEGGKPLSVNH